VAAYADMNANLVEGAANVIVVLTNSGEDTASLPTVGETAEALASMAGSATVYTVGFGEANAENLTQLAAATGGEFLPAPSEGGVLGAIAPA